MRKTFLRPVALLAFAVLCVSTIGATPPVEKRPFFLVVYADWCPSCQQLKPVLALINEKYHNKIRFVRFDITSEETLAKSQERVERLGLSKFFEKNHDQTSLVVILDAAHREVFRTVNDYNPEHYEVALDQQLRTADER